MTWWGGDTRRKITDDAVAEYAESAPDVTITTEPAEFSAYWDKLATQTAAGDAPDIIQMVDAYLSEYAQRGALLDLSTAGLDTSGFTEGLAEAGTLTDAGQVGVCGSTTAPVLLANPDIFAQAGMELPDDSSWTWPEYLAFAEEISSSTDDVYGTSQYVVNPVVFRLWMRQHAQGLWADGGLGFDEEAAQGFFEFARTMLDSPAGPDAEHTQEDYAGGFEQSFFATGRQAMTVAWSNQSVAYASALGGDVVLLRLPAAEGSGGDHRMWLAPGVFWSVAASSTAPDDAVAFLNYLLNDPGAGSLLGVERGVPPNTEVREAVKAELEGTDLEVLEYVETIAPEVSASPEIAPMGGSIFESLLSRIGESFMFGEIDEAAAAKSMVDELGTAIA
jgi:multiple sugar transport system substrate-binding protein